MPRDPGALCDFLPIGALTRRSVAAGLWTAVRARAGYHKKGLKASKQDLVTRLL
jgi:hypothetical protein